MKDADMDSFTDDCLLEVFERLSLLDQVRASKVCRRWNILCQRLFYSLFTLRSDGNVWTFERRDGTIATASIDPEITESVLETCSQFINKLRLNLSGQLINSNDLHNIMSVITVDCRNLRLIEFEMVKDEVILSLIPILIRRNENLNSLKLKNVDDLDMSEVISQLPKCLFEFQILSPTPMDPPIDPHLLIKLMSSCPKLISFACNNVNDVVAEFIGFQNLLKYLHLKFSFTTARSFNHIARLKDLSYLDLGGCRHIEDENFIKITENCQQLEGLIISSCNKITDIGISSIANLNRLKGLQMKELDKVTDASIAILPASLKLLYCCGCVNVSDDGVIQFLTRAPNLQELQINSCQITISTIEAAIRIVKNQGSRRNLKIYAEHNRIDPQKLLALVVAKLPPLLQLQL